MNSNTLKIVLFLIYNTFFSFYMFTQQKYLNLDVQYLSNVPNIDGKLDSNLLFLKTRYFPIVDKSLMINENIEATYRIAYGTNFFYVYIEAKADSLIYRDRAFQNGDGFQLLLAKPKIDKQVTDEFYVLACSAVNNKRMEWSRNIFWYYNVDHIFKKTSKDTKLQFIQHDDKISFELILPWKDVYPYHPWISENIGFNLCFVKATAKNTKIEFKVLEDELGAENNKRKYVFLKFQKPNHYGDNQTYLILTKNNINIGEKIFVTAVTVAAKKNEEHLVFNIKTDKNINLADKNIDYSCIAGINRKSFKILEREIPKGAYKVDWNSTNTLSSGSLNFTVLPIFDNNALNKEINSVKYKIDRSSYNTFKYQLLEINKDLMNLKTYEHSPELITTINNFYKNLELAKKGIDIFANETGFLRKAYKSKLDKSFIPYVVFIPKEYDVSKNYPLLVYLHGSASDETNLLAAKQIIPKGFIALCPNGRGKSNCYSWDFAQTDIAESIDAVIKSYSIDEKNIFLAGFSMGGYGVYRTYYETPEKFKALAIFSGHPNLANEFSSNSNFYPDFRLKQYYNIFKSIPMFIFHGKKDSNCFYNITEKFVFDLINAHTNVKFVTEQDAGHELPNKQTLDIFFDWVNKNKEFNHKESIQQLRK